MKKYMVGWLFGYEKRNKEVEIILEFCEEMENDGGEYMKNKEMKRII